MLKTPLWELPMLHTQMVTSLCAKATDLWSGVAVRKGLCSFSFQAAHGLLSQAKILLDLKGHKAQQSSPACSLCEASRQHCLWGAAAHPWPSRVCRAHTSPLWGLPFCRAPMQFLFKSFWFGLGGWWGKGSAFFFFFFLQLGISNVSFSSVILSLQSGANMILHYVNIKDNCKALIKANFVSSPSLPPSSRFSQGHNKLNQLPQIMHALAREIQQDWASQGQRNILSSSISLCFLQPSFVVCHGKNSNEALSAAAEIPVRHKYWLLLLFISQIRVFCYPVLLWGTKATLPKHVHWDRLDWH